MPKQKSSAKKNTKKVGIRKLTLHKETIKDMKTLLGSAKRDRQSVSVCVA